MINLNISIFEHFLSIFTFLLHINYIFIIIANSKKYLQFDWLRGVQYWPYLYFVLNTCTL